MAVDMFMDINGVTGESRDTKYSKKIDVLAWSWGMHQSGTTHTGTGGGSGKVAVQDLSFTKWVDSASTQLMLFCSNGKHVNKAQLIVRKAGGDSLEYLKITMTEVLITSIATGGSGGEDRFTENVTLNFAEVKVEYTPQKDDGSTEATKNYIGKIAQNHYSA